MTSHKYLSKKKGAAYTFFSGLSSALVPGIVIALLELIVFAIMPAVTLSNQKKAIDPSSGKKLSDSFKFISSVLEENIIAAAVIIFLAVLSIAAAVILLRFMADKRTVNVYYSLGIKRRTLFSMRYLAGVVILTVAPIIAVVAGYIVNLSYLGMSWQLSVVYLHTFLGIWIFSLLMYTLTAAVFSSVGTVSEGVLYSVGIAALPSAILYSLENLLTAFVPSVTYNTRIVAFGTSDYFSSTAAQSLMLKYLRYNPLLFFVNELYAYSAGRVTSNGIELANSSLFSFPDLGIPLFWLPFIIVIAILGCIFFMRRNAENCGFLNTNKVLANAVLFELIMLAVSVPMSQTYYYPVSDVLIGGAVAALVVYIIFEIFLKRNAKRILKTLYKFPAHAVIVAIIIGMFSTGLFGYASRVPDVSDIKAASVSLPASVAALCTDNSDHYYGGYYSSSQFAPIDVTYGFYELPEMTSDADIKKVAELHEKLVRANTENEKSLATLTFRYELDNGKQESRKVFVKDSSLLRESLELFDTDACKAQIEKLLGTDWSTLKNDNGKFATYEDSAYACLIYENAYVSFVNKTLQESYEIDLTKDEFNAIKDAVKKDLTAQNAADMFDGTSKMLGVLSFQPKTDAAPDLVEGMSGVADDYASVPNEEPADEQNDPTDDNENALPADDDDIIDMPDGETEPEEPEEVKKAHYTRDSMGSIFSSQRNYNVIVTEKMTNTVNALKKAGLDEVFTSRLTVKSISFAKYDFSDVDNSTDSNPVHDITAHAANGSSGDYYDYETGNSISAKTAAEKYTQNVITDSAKINEVMSKLSLRRLIFDGDLACVVIYSDDSVSVYPLSSADAPDYVSSYNYRTSFYNG